MSLFDFDRDIHAAMHDEWDLSPAAFASAVITDSVSSDTVAQMVAQLCDRCAPARMRLHILCDVVRAAAEVVSFMPASQVAVDNDRNDAILASTSLEVQLDEVHMRWEPPPVPEWRRAAAVAHRHMEMRATDAASDCDADAIRAAHACDLAEQKAMEDNAIEEHRRRTVDKAHLVMRRAAGHHAHLVCMAVGVPASIKRTAWQAHDDTHWIALTEAECERWRSAKHRFWADGMRMLYGPLLAAWPRADLAQLRVAALVAIDSQLPHAIAAWLSTNVVWLKRQSRNLDLLHPIVHSLVHAWDVELQRSVDATNATAILSRGIRTADGHALYADAVYSIAAMLDPHTQRRP